MVKTRGTPSKISADEMEMEEDTGDASDEEPLGEEHESPPDDAEVEHEESAVLTDFPEENAESVVVTSLPLDRAAKEFYQRLFTEHEVNTLKSPAGRSIKKYGAKCRRCERRVTSTDSFYGFRAHYQTKHLDILLPAENDVAKKRFRDAGEPPIAEMVPLEVAVAEPVDLLPWDRSGKEFFQRLFVNHMVGKEHRKSDNRMGTRYSADCKICGKHMMGLDGFFKFREHYKLRHAYSQLGASSTAEDCEADQKSNADVDGQPGVIADRPAKDFFNLFFLNHVTTRDDVVKPGARRGCVRIGGECRLCGKKVQCTDTYHGFRAHVQHKHKELSEQPYTPLSEFVTFPGDIAGTSTFVVTTSSDTSTYTPRDKSAKVIFESLFTGHESSAYMEGTGLLGKERRKDNAACLVCGRIVTGNSSYYNFKAHALECQSAAALAITGGQPSTSTSSTKRKKKGAAGGPTGPVPSGHPVQEKLAKNVAMCAAEILVPLEALSSPCFDRLVKDIDARLAWPSLTALTTKHIPELRAFIKDSIIRDLTSVPAVAVTVNIWALQPHGHFSVLVHYVDDQWRIRNPVVTFRQFVAQPTAKALSDSILATLKEFSVTDQVIYVDVNDTIPAAPDTTESEASGVIDSVHDKFAGARLGKVVKELKQLLLHHLDVVECKVQMRNVVRTFTIILEECVKESKEVSALFRKIGNIPAVWKKAGSTMASTTAWEAILQKAKSAANFNWEATTKLKIKLTDEEQAVLADFLKVADGFEEFFQKMRQEDVPTVCDLIPFVYGLRQHLTSCAEEAEDAGRLVEFPRSILELLDTQFEGVDDENLYVLASFVNPNYKLDWCKASPVEQKRETVRNLILEKMNELNPEGEVTAETVPEPKQTPTKRRPTLLSFMGDLPSQKIRIPNGSSSTAVESWSAEAELEDFLREDTADENPLSYWKRNKDRFKRLSRLAESVLFIPAVPTKVKLFQNALAAEKKSQQFGGQLESILFCHVNPEIAGELHTLKTQ